MILRVGRQGDRTNHPGLRGIPAFAALTVPAQAMASREVDSLSIVPTIFGAILREAFGSMLVAAAIIAAVVIPWWLLRAGRSVRPPPRARANAALPPESRVSLLQPSAPADGENQDAAQRRAQMRARAEAINLRPEIGGYTPVDEDTRARIAAAARRLAARASETPATTDGDAAAAEPSRR